LIGWSDDKIGARFSPKGRARAVRLVFEHSEDYASQWAAIGSIAAKIGCTAETLRRWVRQAERDQGQRSGPTTDEKVRLKALEREVRELRQANEILRKASAYFDGVDAPTRRHRRVPPRSSDRHSNGREHHVRDKFHRN